MPGDNKGVFSGPHGHEVRQGHLELPDRCSRRHQERPLDDGPPLRLPAPEEALLPLHAGSGCPDHGHSEGQAPGGLQGLHLHDGPHQGGQHPLRHGLDAAHRGRPEHPHDGHHPAAAGQHGHPRRRRAGPSRRVQRPGLDGPGAAVPHLAGLPRDPPGLQPHPQGLHGGEDPPDQGVEGPQLAEEHAQVHCELPALHVRHERDAGGGLQPTCPSSTTAWTTPGSRSSTRCTRKSSRAFSPGA